MKVALLTEGLSEIKALPLLYPQLTTARVKVILQPLKLHVAPEAPVAAIAREAKPKLLIAANKGADFAIVLLDRERQSECPGEIASRLESALIGVCVRPLPVRVVLKDRAFENWLVADLEALKAQPGRFQVTEAIRRRVQPNKADHHDGVNVMKAVVEGDYEKVSDSARICARMDVQRAALHSRSFRHFLHVLEHPSYTDQCRRPAA